MPLDIQVKLLRALQEGEIDPVGARRPQRVDVRLISATNRNLIELVKRGQFREDLFYRLNVFPIGVPPLRTRRQDIPDLARRFTARIAAEEGKTIRGLSGEALTLLERYDWPGNVRQLENAISRAVVLADRNGDTARAAAASCGAIGVQLDVTDEAAIIALVEQVEREQGPIDIFFSNAGAGVPGNVDATNADWQSQWELHVKIGRAHV